MKQCLKNKLLRDVYAKPGTGVPKLSFALDPRCSAFVLRYEHKILIQELDERDHREIAAVGRIFSLSKISSS